MTDLEEGFFSDSNVHLCQFCSGRMIYKGSGRYLCEQCGKEYLTDFGKVKAFLEENGPSNAVVISQETGVSRRKISEFLTNGRMEIVSETGSYLFCAHCGKAIRTGKYCADCEKIMSARSQKGIYNGLAEGRTEHKGEMRFVKPNGKK